MKYTCLFIAILSVATIVLAQNEFVGPEDGIGARGFAMGGAQAALGSDFSACYWNPAALTTIHQHELMVAFSYYSLTDSSRYNAGPSYVSNINGLGLQSIGYVHPIPTVQGGLVMALGYSRPTNISTVQDGPGGIYKAQGYLSKWNFALGLMLLKNLSVGTNLYLNSGNDEATLENAAARELMSDVGSFFGFGFDVGMLLEVTDNLRMGLSATLYNGDNSERHAEDIRRDTLYAVNDKKVYIENPVKVRGGLGYHSVPFSLEADVVFTNWENSKYYQKDLTTPFHNSSLTNTLEYNVGAEFLVPLPAKGAPGIKLRGGYTRSQQPDLTVSSPEGRNSVSGGVGLLFEKALLLEAAGRYSFSTLAYTDYGTVINESVIGKTLFISLSYRY